jgi:hypothetical protein
MSRKNRRAAHPLSYEPSPRGVSLIQTVVVPHDDRVHGGTDVPDAGPSVRYRLEYLDSLVLALDHVDQVTRILLDSEDREHAVRRMQDLLSVTDVGARAIFGMSWGRLNREGQVRIRAERDSLLSQIDRSEPPSDGRDLERG